MDDGSNDGTSQIIRQVALIDHRYRGIFLARNYGHQIAISAGLAETSASDAVLLMDGDLQDPPELITSFYEHYKQGYDVVFAIRKNRKENFFKKICYVVFYRIMKSISNIEMPLDSGDFSLMSRRVVNVLNQMPEESRYIRGMRSWIGFKQIGIEYERQERIAGKPKYSFKKLIQLAYNGIFNFSEFPVKFITRVGMIAIGISLFYLALTLIKKYFFGNVPEGFTALLFAIILFSGVQLVSLGIIGEYVLRIFFQVKGRPLYIVKERTMKKEIAEKEYIESSV